MGEQRKRWSAGHRWQHPGGFCKRAGAAAVRDSGARSMEDARAADKLQTLLQGPDNLQTPR
jgi:hypothetical protein